MKKKSNMVLAIGFLNRIDRKVPLSFSFARKKFEKVLWI